MKTRTCLATLATLEREADDARGPATHHLLDQRMVYVVRQACVVDRRHLGMLLQMRGHFDSVLANTVHAQCQRFNALQNLKRIHRAERCAHIAQRHHTATANVGSGAKSFGVHHTVVAHIWLVQAFKPSLVLSPRKLTRIDHRAAYAGAVATEIFSQ